MNPINKPKHTPLPWGTGADYITGADKTRIAFIRPTPDAERELADARLIVRSVNTAPKLAEALRELRESIESDATLIRATSSSSNVIAALNAARAALAEWDAP